MWSRLVSTFALLGRSIVHRGIGGSLCLDSGAANLQALGILPAGSHRWRVPQRDSRRPPACGNICQSYVLAGRCTDAGGRGDFLPYLPATRKEFPVQRKLSGGATKQQSTVLRARFNPIIQADCPFGNSNGLNASIVPEIHRSSSRNHGGRNPPDYSRLPTKPCQTLIALLVPVHSIRAERCSDDEQGPWNRMRTPNSCGELC